MMAVADDWERNQVSQELAVGGERGRTAEAVGGWGAHSYKAGGLYSHFDAA